MAAVRHGTLTIQFDPAHLTGKATLQVTPHDDEPFDVEVSLLDLLGAQAKLCTRLGQLVTKVADAAKQVST